MSLRNQPLRSGLVAGFAVTLFGSLLALGCVQGPKGAFNRVWGPESYAAKTSKALKGIGKKETAVDEEKEKLADSKSSKSKSKKDSIAQAAGKKDASSKMGAARRSSTSKETDIAAKSGKGTVLSPFVKKRNPKAGEVEDPFLKDLQRTEIAANTHKPATKNVPKTTAQKPGVAFAKGFDTQLTQIKKDVAREKSLAEALKKKTEAEAAAMAAARLEVDALLTEARTADKRGDLDRAKKLARSADELVASRKIVLASGEERPEDFLQHIREKEVVQANAKKAAAALASSAASAMDDELLELRRPEDVRRDLVAAVPAKPVAKQSRPALKPTAPQAVGPELAEEVAAIPEPKVQIRVQRVAVAQPLPQPRHLAADSDEQTVVQTGRRAQSGKSIVRETELSDNMIFDSKIVDWRFPIANRTSPAASDYKEVQVSYQEPVRPRSVKSARVTANAGGWTSTKEGHVRSNRGSIVTADAHHNAPRFSRDEMNETDNTRVQMSSHSVRGSRFAEVSAKALPDSAPDLLQNSGNEQLLEAAPTSIPVPQNSPAESSNGWSFILGVCFAGIFAVGLALRNRVRIEKPRS